MPVLSEALAWLDNKRRVAAQNAMFGMQNPVEYLNQSLHRAVEDNLPSRLEMADARSVMPGMGDVVQNKMLGLAMGAGPGKVVFHGSPAKFAKFDTSKIGTGEGNQAFTRGHYVAENPDVGKDYALKLATPGKETYMYKVDLPDEHIAKMLDWDAPLSKQAPEVQKFMQELTFPKEAKNKIWKSVLEQDPSGDYLITQLQRQTKDVEGLLKAAGIPGVKYKDMGSRGGLTADKYVVTNKGADGHTINSFTFPSKAAAEYYLQSKAHKANVKDYGIADAKIEMHPGKKPTQNFVVYDDSLLNILGHESWMDGQKVAPRVGYHGTNKQFEQFDEKFHGTGQGYSSQVPGFWFTADPKMAPAFGSRVVKANLGISNPFVMPAAKYMQKFMYNGEDPAAFKAKLIKQGYDGLHIKADPEYAGGRGPSGTEEWGVDNWVVFNPKHIEQVK